MDVSAADAPSRDRPDLPERPVPDTRPLPRPPAQPGQADRHRLAERLDRMESPVGVRAELVNRLNTLAPGHPSSPWDERGIPRPPVPRLTDLDRPRPPLSDADYAAHVAEVAKSLDHARAAGLTTDNLYTIDANRDIWADDRAAMHNEIIEAVYQASAAVPCERRAIVAGGLGAAGKTTVLDEHPGLDRSKFLTINPDSFKEELAKRGMVPRIPGLSPMEASTLAHEESSYLARQLALRAMADGKNIIWDITMSSSASTARRMAELRATGYQKIEGIFVDIPIEASVARMGERHRRGHERFLAGLGLGGRYVPAEVIRAQADPEYGSTNRRTFETLKGQFDRWTVYDNSISGRPAVIVEQSGFSKARSIDGTDSDD